MDADHPGISTTNGTIDGQETIAKMSKGHGISNFSDN